MTVITLAAVRLISLLKRPFPCWRRRRGSRMWRRLNGLLSLPAHSLAHSLARRLTDMRSSQNVNQTRKKKKKKKPNLTQTNSLHSSIQVRVTAQQRLFCCKYQVEAAAARRPFVVGAGGDGGGGRPWRVGGGVRLGAFESRLLDSISSSVTSADYVSGKQAALLC